MEVILLERIEKLGLMGDVVNVKPGYARNYLLPLKKAISATVKNKERFKNQRVQFEAQNLESKKEAETIGKKLDGNIILMVRQAGEGGQLYGSVNARDVANRIIETGFNIKRSQISLERPIKTVGLHSIKIALHPEVLVTVTANVARSDEEAEIQEKTGQAVITGDAEQYSLIEEVLASANEQETPQHQETQKAHEDSEVNSEN